MLLPEHKSKALLRDAGIRVPAGTVICTQDDATRLLHEGNLSFPAAVKALVASGGRGKRGGVRRAATIEEARTNIAEMLAMGFDGEKPEAVLIEPWMAIERELYLSIVIDASADGYMALYSPEGGIEVESGAFLVRYPFGMPRNFRAYQFRECLAQVESDGRLIEQISVLGQRLLRVATSRDCTTVEINPLAVVEGRLVAIDAKIVRDEWAASRNADIMEEIHLARSKEPEVVQSSLEMNHMYVPIDGDIGIISGGAGMTMCVMDMIAQQGGKPACFLDCSPGPTSARGYQPAFALLDADPGIRAILVSIFGGGTQMQRVANAMKTVLANRTSSKPVVFRLNGTNVDQANEIMAGIGLKNHPTLESAVHEVIQLAEAGA